MPTPETYLSFGSIVAAIGIGLVCLHVRSHRRHQTDDDLAESDHRFFDQQYSRRMQTSALTITLGALISLCGYLRIFDRSPVFATLYVVALLGLAMWLILLALSDGLATRIYAAKLNRRNRQVRKSLQQALAEVREAHGLDTDGTTSGGIAGGET